VLEKPRAFFQTISRATAGRQLYMFATAEVKAFDSWGDCRKQTDTREKFPPFKRIHRQSLEARS
jgi:hypothetical protein